ncbi:MAG: SUMF1/EgtB/PvdO family nonheme iron enzyme [Verrucomicrobiota bacterium]
MRFRVGHWGRPGSGGRELTGVLRGGSWINNDPANLRAANRNNDHPGNRNNNGGFRVVVVCG